MVNKINKRMLMIAIAAAFLLYINNIGHNSTNTVFTNSIPRIRGWVQERDSVYNKRRGRVKTVCDSSKDDLHHGKQSERFIFDMQNGMAFCINLKVGF